MKTPTDFNDAANLTGLDAVRDAIEHAAENTCRILDGFFDAEVCVGAG